MKDKIKSKLSDAFFIFTGSVLALIISTKYTANITTFMKSIPISASNIEKFLGILFSFSVVIGYIVSMVVWATIKKLIAFNVRPKILITYTNEKNKTLEILDFKKNPEEPQFLRIKFSAKFNLLQLTLLKMMQCKVKMEMNPKIFSVELNDGFETDEHSEINNNVWYFKIFDLYSSSKNETQIFKDLQLQRISAGVSEIKFSMEVSNSKLKWFLYKYCIFDVKNLQIEG
ncbi:hypothetical protein LZ480_07840 [Solibacillus sp. MA9]|uniref:SMODS-associating 2TM beta-strand rich effector domain-containing protein n=1 Tax=Solibacillus palustris TaxID=2908203 RepID=A0ABS9UCC8_9BACL|nr:hypothetical protein [Solibacillus sp. MA9]MCH7321804.1 hypothetical protein [Solibacillus sp. MA9]